MSGLNCELYPVGPNQALTKDYLEDIANLNTAVSNYQTSITELQVESDALLVDIDATLLEITTLQSGEYLLTLNIEAEIIETTVPNPVLQYIEIGLGTTQITKPFSQRYYGPSLTDLFFCYTVPFTTTTPTVSILMLPFTNTEFCEITVDYNYSLTKINQLY